MKKIFISVLALMTSVVLAACSAGATSETTPVESYLPEGAEFIRSEKDDGFTEQKYRDASGEYTLLIDKSDAVRALEYDAAARSTAESIVLSAEEAFAKLVAIYPEAELIAAVEDRDDGRYEWGILFKTASDLAFYELDAATGDILDYDVFFGLADTVNLNEILTANMANASVIEISLDADDGRLWLEGEARTDNGPMEFKIDADSGILIEAEYDD